MHVGGFEFLIRYQLILIKKLIFYQPAVMRTKVLAKGREATFLGTTGNLLFQGVKVSADIPFPYKIQL